jgi:mRNA interferase MazF
MKLSNKHKQFDVWLVNLDPTVGSEIKKTRPCVIVSPNEIHWLKTVIIVPLTSNGFEAPTRIPCNFNNTSGFVVLDQIRVVDKQRLIKCIGAIHYTVQNKVSDVLVEMFSKGS